MRPTTETKFSMNRHCTGRLACFGRATVASAVAERRAFIMWIIHNCRWVCVCVCMFVLTCAPDKLSRWRQEENCGFCERSDDRVSALHLICAYICMCVASDLLQRESWAWALAVKIVLEFSSIARYEKKNKNKKKLNLEMTILLSNYFCLKISSLPWVLMNEPWSVEIIKNMGWLIRIVSHILNYLDLSSVKHCACNYRTCMVIIVRDIRQ